MCINDDTQDMDYRINSTIAYIIRKISWFPTNYAKYAHLNMRSIQMCAIHEIRQWLNEYETAVSEKPPSDHESASVLYSLFLETAIRIDSTLKPILILLFPLVIEFHKITTLSTNIAALFALQRPIAQCWMVLLGYSIKDEKRIWTENYGKTTWK